MLHIMCKTWSRLVLTNHASVCLQVSTTISSLPAEISKLSRLQLLNLSHNQHLELDGYLQLGQAPLHKVQSVLNICVCMAQSASQPVQLHQHNTTDTHVLHTQS